MAWIHRLIFSLRRRRFESELDRELQFHLEMRTLEKLPGGATPEDARKSVLRRFGNLDRTKEACREVDTMHTIETAWQDVRYALRAIRTRPGFTAAAVLCLGLGIGANTAIFSFVNAFLFRPLAVEQPDALASVRRPESSSFSYAEYQDWKRLNRPFSGLAAYTPGEGLTLGLGPGSERVLGEAVTSNYFRVLGLHASVGRMFAEGEDDAPLAVISNALWTRKFGRDPSTVGRTLQLDREAFTIIGVAPAAYLGMLSPWTTDIWTTLALHRDRLRSRNIGWLVVTARLRPGFTPAQAEVAMRTLDSELLKQQPAPQGRAPGKLLVRTSSGGIASSPVWNVFTVMAALLMTVVGIIFLIACANVAGLTIARDLARRREIMIRLALGAGRWRLVRQLLTESCLLGLMGAMAGVLAAFCAGGALAGFLPASISGGFRIQHGIDGRVLAFTLALALASTLFCGLIPALRASDQNLAAAGKTQSPSGSRTPRLRQILIVAQVAMSVLVLVTAGIFVRSFQKAQQSDLGFQPARLLTVYLDLHQLHYPEARTADFYRQVRQRVAALPGVDSVSLTDAFPMGRSERVATVFMGDGAPAAIATSKVDAAYFRTMGITLAGGRAFQPDDHDAVIVNEAMAHRFWPDQDAIGKSIRLSREGEVRQVVGVARNGKYWSMHETPRPFLYRLADGRAEVSQYLLIRTAAAPEPLIRPVRSEIEKLNGDLLAPPVQTAAEVLSKWLEPESAAAGLLSILGFMALGLAVTGLYGLLAQLVTQRTPEIAVRMAVGASRSSIAGLVLRQSLVWMALGIVIGAAAALAITRALGSFARVDLATLAAVAALLALVGAAAALVPAWRAARVDPVAALRME